MKKAITLLLASVCSLALATSAVAAKKSTSLGMGVAIGNDNDTTLFLPIQPADGKLWFEPYLAYHNESPDKGSSSSSLGIGTGLFVDFESSQKTRAYFGGRVGLASVSPSVGDSYTAFTLAPTVGFGYLPVSNVMLGAEASFGFTTSDAGSEFGTNSAVFLRYFFQ